MVKLVMLQDHEEGDEGDIVDVPAQTALDLIEAGVARGYLGQEEEEQQDRFPELPERDEM